MLTFGCNLSLLCMHVRTSGCWPGLMLHPRCHRTLLPLAVSFQEEGMQFVDLSERPILARYAAVGQMNFVPGVWDPT